MFDLESAIVDWRQQMLAAGIAPAPLDELESHLREVIEQRLQAGFAGQFAFDSAVQQVGRAAPLKTEFAKTGETLWDQVKHLLLLPIRIPNFQLATNMNMETSLSKLEPRWATYSKTITYSLPALFLWAASYVFVMPKLKQICAASGTAIPGPLLTALALSDLFKNYLIVLSVLFFGALALLEWRFRSWSRHRRVCFGIAAFTMNFVALILITAMLIIAVLAGSNLLSHAK
jgi:hypothetical protein